MPLAKRRICGLCGRAFALVSPPDEEETEQDKRRVGSCRPRPGGLTISRPEASRADPVEDLYLMSKEGRNE
jgi:hypothetical protein